MYSVHAFLYIEKKGISGGTQSHVILHTGQMLYQLSYMYMYQGSPAGQAESSKVTQGQGYLSPDAHSYSNSIPYVHAHVHVHVHVHVHLNSIVLGVMCIVTSLYFNCSIGVSLYRLYSFILERISCL